MKVAGPESDGGSGRELVTKLGERTTHLFRLARISKNENMDTRLHMNFK